MNREGANLPVWRSSVYVPKSPPSGRAEDCARLPACRDKPGGHWPCRLWRQPGALEREAKGGPASRPAEQNKACSPRPGSRRVRAETARKLKPIAKNRGRRTLPAKCKAPGQGLCSSNTGAAAPKLQALTPRPVARGAGSFGGAKHPLQSWPRTELPLAVT